MNEKRMFLINPLRDDRWMKFISKNERANVFHHPSWLRVLCRQYGFPVFAACIQSEDSDILAGIPFCEVRTFRGQKKWISLPFSDYCPVLAKDINSTNTLVEALVQQGRSSGISTIEIRDDIVDGAQFVGRCDSVLHTTRLEGNLERLFSTFKKTQVQQSITKSIKDGLKAEVTDTDAAVQLFYRLHIETRRRLGVPVQPKSFFHLLFEEIIRPGLGFVVLVKYSGTPVAAGIFGGYSKILTYKYGASDVKYLRLRPNNLLLWVAMQEAVRLGYSIFDFGKTEMHNEGLRKFKSGWGSIESPLCYSYFPNEPSTGPLDTISRRVVAPIVRYSPAFVCRVMGELFYRFSV